MGIFCENAQFRHQEIRRIYGILYERLKVVKGNLAKVRAGIIKSFLGK